MVVRGRTGAFLEVFAGRAGTGFVCLGGSEGFVRLGGCAGFIFAGTRLAFRTPSIFTMKMTPVSVSGFLASNS